MLHSMTGFSRQTAETEAGTLTCEMRTVNHRYLDVQFRLPEELRCKEADLRQQIAGVVRRGKVDCGLHLHRGAGGGQEIAIDRNLVAQIAARASEIAEMLPDAEDPDPLDILRWPGVVLDAEIDADPLYADSVELLDEALAALQSMRRSEGERIAGMLKTRCADIRAISQDVRRRMPDVLAAIRQRQKDRLDKLDVDADPERLEAELALITQKLDVDEELDRLDSHVVEILEVIEREEPVGRRLDFLMQELNREANTLGSKSADTGTTRAAVELKVLIEQMREQIQNVE